MPIVIVLIGITAARSNGVTTLKFACTHGPRFLRGLCLQ
jgi:hypothetical protein